MKGILAFFRDTLIGNLYVAVSFVCIILICICIHLLLKRRKLQIKQQQLEDASKVVIVDPSGSNKRVEVNFTLNNTNSEQFVSEPLSVTSVLAAQDIYNDEADTSLMNGDTSLTENVPSNKKIGTPIFINPMEVAEVSSTLNVFGATSEQKSAISKNSAADSLNSIENNEVI